MEDKLSPLPFFGTWIALRLAECVLLPACLYVPPALMRIMQMHQVPNENVNFIYTALTRLHIREVCQMSKLENQWCKAHHPGFLQGYVGTG